MMRSKFAVASLAALTALGSSVSVANATAISVTSSLTPVALTAFTVLDLTGQTGTTGFTSGDATVSFSGVAPELGVVAGAAAGHAIPVTGGTVTSSTYLNGSYLAVGTSGSIDIHFATPATSVALLWGSVDPLNTVTFLNGSTTIGSVTGSDVTATPNGSQSYGGSYYTVLSSKEAFTDAVFSSPNDNTFEFAAFEYDPPIVVTAVPEPGSLSMLGLGLIGLIGLRRRA